jgi:hypothetical protein
MKKTNAKYFVFDRDEHISVLMIAKLFRKYKNAKLWVVTDQGNDFDEVIVADTKKDARECWRANQDKKWLAEIDKDNSEKVYPEISPWKD